jgi:hypothetical protein
MTITKYLLTDYMDYRKMLDREWLDSVYDRPSHYPCVAVVYYDLSPGKNSVEFVYLENFINIKV